MGAPDTGMTGLIHIYCGDGKGKTTAGMGLCVRAAGYGYKVLVCQFMKDNRSSELGALKQIPQITVLPGPDQELFSFQMSPRQKEEKKRFFEQRLLRAFRHAQEEAFSVLFLDEVLYTVGLGLLEEEHLIAQLRSRPPHLEVILTGAEPSDRLQEMADYVSRICKIKHPYDRGVKARPGIEM